MRDIIGTGCTVVTQRPLVSMCGCIGAIQYNREFQNQEFQRVIYASPDISIDIESSVQEIEQSQTPMKSFATGRLLLSSIFFNENAFNPIVNN